MSAEQIERESARRRLSEIRKGKVREEKFVWGAGMKLLRNLAT